MKSFELQRAHHHSTCRSHYFFCPLNIFFQQREETVKSGRNGTATFLIEMLKWRSGCCGTYIIKQIFNGKYLNKKLEIMIDLT